MHASKKRGADAAAAYDYDHMRRGLVHSTAWAYHRWEGCVEAVVESTLVEVSKTAALSHSNPNF